MEGEMMRERLKTIKERLKADTFAHEAAISLGAVLPIIMELGWDIMDTDEVAPEWRTAKGRVDFALCIERAPKVFLEIKQPGTFESGIEQLLQYAFTEGVSMAVLSDGRRWSVYLPGEQGSYTERRVDLLDVVERPVDDVQTILRRYLEKQRVLSDNYLENAKQDLHSAARRQRAKDAIPRAWRKLLEETYGEIATSLIEAVEEEAGIAPSEEDVRNFLEKVSKNSPMDVPTRIEIGRPIRITGSFPNDPDQAFENAVKAAQFNPQSPTTTKIYKKRWLAFTNWAIEHGVIWLPAESEEVKNWIDHEWPTRTARTLTHDLAAIGLVHRALSTENNPVDTRSPARKLLRECRMKEQS